jgi:hypothetical protein
MNQSCTSLRIVVQGWALGQISNNLCLSVLQLSRHLRLRRMLMQYPTAYHDSALSRGIFVVTSLTRATAADAVIE